jgi:hypothetical protein
MVLSPFFDDRRPMKTQNFAASPSATTGHASNQVVRRITGATAGFGLALGLVLGGCGSPAASSLPSVSVPSIDASAAASVGAQAALTALDQVDAAITANTSSTGLSSDDAASLTQLSSGARTSLTTGDVSAARTAVENLSTKVQSFAAKLSGPAGTQLTSAVEALKAALPAS